MFRCLEENYPDKEAPNLHVALFDIEVDFDKDLFQTDILIYFMESCAFKLVDEVGSYYSVQKDMPKWQMKFVQV